MCGIFCEICFCNKTSTMDDQVMKRIKNRGPDKSNSLEIALGDDMKAFLNGAVLWMQGPELAPQPVETEQGVLLYNGDIFDETWPSNISDTIVIKDKLHDKSNTLSEEYIIQQLKSFKGPFAMIYLDKINKKIYFMRDRIGRSTLLFHKSKNSIIISNVLGRNYNCVEVPATCIQILNLNTNTIKVYPWDNNELKTEEYLIEDWLEQLKMQQNLPDDEFYFEYIEEQFKENDEIIKLIESTAASTQCKLSAMKILIEDNLIKKTVLNVTELLEKSIKLRLQKQPNRCKKCLNTEGDCKHCTVGILFSGGLDCTILAVLADKYLPREQSIDLINVAFKKDEKSTFDVPDRLTGRQSLQELQKLCPTRDWIFREVNVSKEEQEKYQEDIIGDLVYPRETILDESLGTALWFAARGQDCLHDVSTSRVLLIGSGADELFGGYTRHRNAFKRKGWQGLNKELLLDWKRISFRNLARDNRVICDHGRQPRMPYLDEDFTNYILQLKPWLRCFPSEDLGIGMGDKLMLRLVALNLGLSEANTKMAANRRKQDDKNLEILRELISLNGNKYCLDCNQRGPTYVNSTIGSFVCSKCSGMLRGLTPPHRVKSISMATFTPEEIEFIKARGNDYCRRVWLGLYEGESVNFTDEQSVKDFMSDKYEKKRYYLDSPATTNNPVNGSSSKNKPKVKTGSNASSAAPLISISPQTSKNTVNNNTVVQTAKVVNNLLPANDLSYRVAQPVNNLVKPIMNTVNVTPVPAAVPASVPDFPVDFSTANIYNSSQINNNMNNSFATPPSMTAPAFNAFSTPPQPANDRYAALADLDMALRQQNMKHMEENNVVNNKNPFQSTTTNDLFASKNPFFNGGWSTATATVPVNPFMQSTNNGGFMNSKNPFL
ncbi:hypothetical protein SFRURICE_020625 [Spodoptera frugiperda]|nr:hypothetical protein SFRURICE_020625 [Spodoptera frugiperda]